MTNNLRRKNCKDDSNQWQYIICLDGSINVHLIIVTWLTKLKIVQWKHHFWKYFSFLVRWNFYKVLFIIFQHHFYILCALFSIFHDLNTHLADDRSRHVAFGSYSGQLLSKYYSTTAEMCDFDHWPNSKYILLLFFLWSNMYHLEDTIKNSKKKK